MTIALAAPTRWWENAMCRDRNPLVYELAGLEETTEVEKARIARRLCRGCPVIRECAADALAVPYDAGVVRGGVWLTPTPTGVRRTPAATQRLSAVANDTWKANHA